MKTAGLGGSVVVRRTSRGPIVVSDGPLRGALGIIDRVAASSCTVLVTGESGTGKELAVAALHDASPRASRPLIAVNCGAIPEQLVESELFGHVRGAFTGAVSARQGFVAAAEGGTLFLDEIGELPLSSQVKLLRLLQRREYTPVGDSRVIPCDVRIVAATNRDLAAEVEAGRFREDLYYRFNVINVRLPPLRERRADIPLLARHFLRACVERTGRPDVVELSDEAEELLVRHDWPGNVRALENAIERAMLLAPGTEVRAEDLPPALHERPYDAAAPRVSLVVPVAREADEAREPFEALEPMESFAPAESDPGPAQGDTVDLRAAVEAFENDLIQRALNRAGWNKTRAAQFLGLHRTTLVEMMKRKRIDRAA